MQKKTYLQECLQKGRIIRWADNCMPLKVYIAPFNFYSNKDEGYTYRRMIAEAFNEWEKISYGAVTFELVDTLLYSQINVEWKRVDRSALGYCKFGMDANNRLYSAEVQIGISDGIIHQQYMNKEEVFHTMLHEVGHSIGLGHSFFKNDIMYTPHQYGVTALSEHDKNTIKWLYKMDVNATVQNIANKYGVQSNDLDEIIAKLMSKNSKSDFEKVKDSLKKNKKDLLEEQTNIADLKKYNLSLQNITISQNIINTLVNKHPKKD